MESDIDFDPANPDIDVESEHENGYMPREEYVWHVEYDDVVVFYEDRENPETGEVTPKHICTLQKLGRKDSNGDVVLGSISNDDMSLRAHRPVEPGYCRKDSVPFRVDINFKPDDYSPRKKRCNSCGKSVNMEATRSPNSAVSSGLCPKCGKSLSGGRGRR